ncbi:MAG: phosphoglucosamine mutase [Oscillospiraceae bacterium]|nr:phosphoglucosamine mutase [Oscillospiraceae bacterium]
MGRIFGTDGVRGIANTELNCNLAMDVARAAAMVVANAAHRKPVFVIGMDTRLSSPMLEAAVTAGLCSVGADVIQLGVVPTPAVAYLVKQLGADAGIMLSASHNPFEFNGLKIFNGEGYKLSDEMEFAIEEIVLDHVLPFDLKWNEKLGTVRVEHSAVEKYIEHIASTVQTDLGGMKILVDCANGSASATAPKLFERLGAKVDFIACEPDGTNINNGCGSTHIDKLCEKVKAGGYDAGLAFDGDADRCLAVDENGEIIDGDRMIAIFAKDLKQKGRLAGNKAVVTVMSNIGFFKFARENGIETEITKVGDRYVLENMLKTGNRIGGEQSGHVIFFDYMPTGDGELSGIQLLAIMKEQGKKLSELAAVMQVFPQVMVNVRADKKMKQQWETDEGVRMVLEKYKKHLGESGRILVRASGTEPLIRVMVEGQNRDEIECIAQEIAQTIKERLQVS